MIFLRAINLSSPTKICAFSLSFPSSVRMSITSNLCFSPRAKSFWSWAGVTFKQPVPNSISTYSSAMMLISLSINGILTFLPIRFLYLSSSGCTQMAESAIMVSGRVVAIIMPLDSARGDISTKLYLMCTNFEGISLVITSSSETVVLAWGSQFTIR